MRTVNFIGLTFVVITTVGCFKNTGPLDGAAADSGLSDVTIVVPSIDQYRAKFGPSCEALNFSAEMLRELGERDRCEATLKILSKFKLNISENIGSCEAGVTPSSISEEGSFAGTTISKQVKKSCSYDVVIEVGRGDPQFLAYYSNIEASKGALTKEDLEDGQASVKLIILPTPAGIKIGFPGDEEDAGIITRPPPTNSGNGSRPNSNGGSGGGAQGPNTGGSVSGSGGGSGNGSGTANSNTVDVSIDIDLGNTNRDDSTPSTGGLSTGTTGSDNRPSVSTGTGSTATTGSPSAGNPDTPNLPVPGTPIANPANLRDSMLGLYVSECKKIEPSDNQFEILSLTVEKDRVIGGRIVTTDPVCRDKTKNIQFTKGYATYKLGAPSGSEKKQTIDIKIEKQNFAVLTVNGAKVWNIEKACGYSLWQRGVPVEVMALEKTSPACSSDLAGILRDFDVVQFGIEGLRVGKKRRDDDGKWYFLGLSEKTRPSTFGKLLKKIKN